MEPPVKHNSSAVQVNTSGDEVKLEDENGLLIKRRRTEYSGGQPKQETEDTDMENKVPDGLPVEVSTGKEPMDTDCAVQSSGMMNGCSKAHVRAMFPAGNEPARLRLQKICTASGWKEPSYDFKEQGPPHSKLYFCKVTVRLEGLIDTFIECFSGPKGKKKAAQEHAAQGALWYLERMGHVKGSSDASSPGRASAGLSAALTNPCFRCHIPCVHVSFKF